MIHDMCGRDPESAEPTRRSSYFQKDNSFRYDAYTLVLWYAQRTRMPIACLMSSNTELLKDGYLDLYS